MRIGIIGVGKVGTSLAQYLISNGGVISGLYDENKEAAQYGAELTGAPCFDTIADLVAISDILFLTVTDDAIETIWKKISSFNLEEKIVCHCSGALSSLVFAGIQAKGAYGYSVHPAMVISHHSALSELAQAPFTIEGADTKLTVVSDLFVAMGNAVHIVTAENKVRYHAAAVFASNFIVALAEISTNLLAECGFGELEQQLFLPLMQTNLDNIMKNGVSKALTGPVERGDVATIKKHLSKLTRDEHDIYQHLSRKLIEIAKVKNPQKNYDELTKTLLKNNPSNEEKIRSCKKTVTSCV